MKTCSHKKLHANIHVSIIHNILKSGGKTNIYQLVSKLCYFYKMKLIKRNKILIHATTWIKVKKKICYIKETRHKRLYLYDFVQVKCPKKANL